MSGRLVEFREATQFVTEVARHQEIALGLSSLMFSMAFSKSVRNAIWNRDGGKSVLSGETEHLEAAHIDHSRDNSKYDHWTNGRLLTRVEHLEDHVTRAGRNGLTEAQNKWAISAIWSRLTEEEKEAYLQSKS